MPVISDLGKKGLAEGASSDASTAVARNFIGPQIKSKGSNVESVSIYLFPFGMAGEFFSDLAIRTVRSR